ncbi:MAG: hypothetical protein A3H96_14820 [Acidobacteria bacterium RIFCSPLOWO2_02_FULL_67_36]|nr:MAG: hypothetical protein A3H96_14820 [Acidobacteria bacterium RIFCSPLOWO2_02_FULL_67_36]OFW19348.1 MAG: hypothetical protein A3G21_02015 [Acidobacteria bacterium RIFCSPLOWO2_12_FULL_66_21]
MTSRHNPAVRRFRELARSRGTGEWMLLDGDHLVEEAIRSGVRLDLVALAEHMEEERRADIGAHAARAGATCVVVSAPVLAAMSPVKNPSGVVAIGRRPSASLDAALSISPQMVLLLDGIQDPGNFGAIVRAAEACGATGIVASEGCADPFGWKALRGGMGSTFRVRVAARQPMAEAIARARHRGARVIAAVPRGGVALPDCDLRTPSAILLGGEGGGLPEALLDAADARVSIPMRAPVESLNVAISAALVLYEAARQRSA